MSNLRYIEITSSHRNRNEWPEPSEFIIPISQTGRKGPIDAEDPVSATSPFFYWKLGDFSVSPQNATITVDIESLSPSTPLGNSGNGTIIYVKGSTVNDVLHVVPDYYNNAILEASPTNKLRIFKYDYLGANRARITVMGSFNPVLIPTTSLTITDPTDFSVPSSPYIFVPGPSLGENIFVNKFIYNETRNETRPMGIYDRTTNLVPLITYGSALSTKTSGPITTWLPTDSVSLRVNAPINSPFQLNGDPINNSLINNVFNLPIATAQNVGNITGNFLERLSSSRGTTGGGNIVQLGSTNNLIKLAPADSSTTFNGYYTGSIIRITVATGVSPNVESQERVIVAYDQALSTVLVEPGFSGNIVPGADKYIITSLDSAKRIIKYVNYQGIAQGGSLTTINFPLLNTNSNVNGFYNNLFVTITGGAATGDIRLIANYVVTKDINGIVTSKVATILNTFPFSAVIGGGDTFSITSGNTDPFLFNIGQDNTVVSPNPIQEFLLLPFSYDNLNPFVYTGSLVSQQELVCYEIQLINLILPNVVLGTSLGSLISFYPYIYLELQNVSAAGAGTTNIIYSNNPNSTKMLFRCPIKDVPNPVNSTFIKIDGSGMVQTIKFRPNDNLFFSVHLPNGDLFKTILPESFSPEPPNPVIQISACFSIKRVS